MKTIRTVSAVFTALLAATAWAQEEVETPREYNVEVIVFVYEEDVSVGNEVFTPEPLPDVVDFSFAGSGMSSGLPEPDDVPANPAVIVPDDQDADRNRFGSPEELVDPADPDAAFAAEGLLPDYVLTPVDELGMIDVIDKLERLDAYNPILHAAWTQRALPRDESITMELSMLAEPPPNLSGAFTLYLSRFLHLTVDLTLDNEATVPVAVEVPNRSLFFGEQPRRQPGVIHYRIEDDRIFKSGDTRYFDHPRFGVVARVTRIEEPEESEEDEESGDAVALDDVAGDQVVQ